MGTRLLGILFIPAAFALGLASAQAQDARLIVRLKDATAKSALTHAARIEKLGIANDVALTHLREMSLGADVVIVHAAGDADAARTAVRIAADPNVEFAAVDQRRRPLQTLPINDEFATALHYLNDDPTSDSVFDAWTITHGSASTVVAVVDTGYRPHFDLTGRFLAGYDMISDPAVANDGDGRDPDASDPGDWLLAGEITGAFANCKFAWSSWHGTSVAGVIAANTDNHVWTAGIDWMARVLPVRALGKCGGYDSDIADGIAWAAGLSVPGVPPNSTPAQIINLSLGGKSSCSPIYPYVAAAAYSHGVTRAIVAAAGNDAEDVSGTAPANCPGYIAVASTSLAGNLAKYSNFGTGIDISAPGGTFNFSVQGEAIIALSNSGITVPADDSFRVVGGTSFSAPMVSGAISLMLAVAPYLTPDQIHSILVGTAKPFPDGSDCTTDRCGAGILDTGAAVRAAAAVPPPSRNYEGLWWNSPANSESGWGINLAHQGDIIFATWFTYDLNGKAWWLSMTATKGGPSTYAGTLYQTRGPPFSASPFDPSRVSHVAVGNGSLAFTDASTAQFTYTVNGVTQTKTLTRQLFGAPPACTFGAQPNLALAGNVQDLWWAAPANSEAGWGINLTEQSNVIFGTWFTYDLDGSPLWLSVTATSATPGIYSGTLYRTTGPAFSATPFDPANVVRTAVGTATFTFSDGADARFSYTVNGVSQVKPITREIFVAPGTVCQ